MNILVADDVEAIRAHVRRLLTEDGHEVEEVATGLQALAALRRPDGPEVALVDWNMPGMTGPEVCSTVRAEGLSPRYLILLTVRNQGAEIAAGLDAGADDYVVKPFDLDELRARVDVGLRMVALQKALVARAAELQEALDHVRTLQGLIPMCMHCHAIRDEAQVWQRIERYLTQHADVRVSHGLCPDCFRKFYPEAAELAARKKAESS